MAPKIHPNSSMTPLRERETFTVWMKSLIFNGKGCTVYDLNGEVVYRVDNYQMRRSHNVFLMDSGGEILFSMHKKKFCLFQTWKGFTGCVSEEGNCKQRPWFQVKRQYWKLSNDMSCRVTVGSGKNNACDYKIIGSKGTSAFQIVDFSGRKLAEGKEKQAGSEVSLGADVMTLTVEPQIDNVLVMALVTVYGLINNKL